jgi:SAM-dependent methyltransferase
VSHTPIAIVLISMIESLRFLTDKGVTAMSDLPEHVRKNRAKWDDLAKADAAAGSRSWKRDTPVWGIWHVPEAELRMLPDDLNGKDAIELGCGTAYVSCWLARRGARVVAIDNSSEQLATARRLQLEHGLDFPLIHGNAESVAYLDASFDFAISEYGACLWADPQRWVPALDDAVYATGRRCRRHRSSAASRIRYVSS